MFECRLLKGLMSENKLFQLSVTRGRNRECMGSVVNASQKAATNHKQIYTNRSYF